MKMRADPDIANPCAAPAGRLSYLDATVHESEYLPTKKDSGRLCRAGYVKWESFLT